jgi:hypothetical protein
VLFGRNSVFKRVIHMGEHLSFLTSARDGRDWLAIRHGRFTSGDRAPGKHLIREWVSPRTDLNAVENLLPLPGI